MTAATWSALVRRAAFVVLAALALGLGASSAQAEEKTHKVARGDSLWGIARAYGITVDQLCDANDLDADAPIKVGQELLIPEKGAKPKPRSDGEAPRAPGALPEWVLAKPAPSTQHQKSTEERGMNPCMTADPGFGVYGAWSRAPSLGQMISPGKGGVTKDGKFDVMFHFHGHEPARKEWVKVMDGAVLVGIDLGIGSGAYQSTFASPATFRALLESVEQAVSDRVGKPAKARKIGLSGWSAGYGAVGEILRDSELRSRVDVVILLDGLHSGYEGASLNAIQLDPFVAFAREAKASRKIMFVSHSSIIPPGYASTTETASYLVYKLGGKPSAAKPRASDPAGLELIRTFDAGGFHLRGYSGNGKLDHCAHLSLYRDVLKVHVKSRWKSPAGTAGS